MKEQSTLWIHSQIKACMDAADCQPDYCLDLFEPSGHGRKRRSLPDASHTHNITSAALVADDNTTQYTRFKENLEYTVVMPGELFHRGTPLDATCATSMMIAAALGALLFMSALLMCYLATRLNSTLLKNNSIHQPPSGKSFEQILRELAHHSIPDTGYTGRPTVQ
ncbi:hypothetical protein JYU34_021089 [Plutella xylostella]|uniref:Uncharacterized protein n=1 Tax=Plutella xylostella TaxID=51655 RepID=A0ABQ7PU74_PLUXY|nr:hypothetical protein JYU34_021089 [Plutella xylostella]